MARHRLFDVSWFARRGDLQSICQVRARRSGDKTALTPGSWIKAPASVVHRGTPCRLA